MSGAPETYILKGCLCIRFGKGAVSVFTGTRNGEPAVFLREADPPGVVGQWVSLSDVEDHPTRVALIFPTAEQAEAVADALVGQQPAAVEGTVMMRKSVLEYCIRELNIARHGDSPQMLAAVVHGVLTAALADQQARGST